MFSYKLTLDKTTFQSSGTTRAVSRKIMPNNVTDTKQIMTVRQATMMINLRSGVRDAKVGL